MHNSRGSGQIDTKVVDQAPDSLHVLNIRFRIEPTSPVPNRLEEAPLLVPTQGSLLDTTAGRNDGDRETWLVSRAVVNTPLGDGYAEYPGIIPLRHQADRPCWICRSSS